MIFSRAGRTCTESRLCLECGKAEEGICPIVRGGCSKLKRGDTFVECGLLQQAR